MHEQASFKVVGWKELECTAKLVLPVPRGPWWERALQPHLHLQSEGVQPARRRPRATTFGHKEHLLDSSFFLNLEENVSVCH